MKRHSIATLALFLAAIVAASIVQAGDPSRQRVLADLGWKFNLGNADGAETASFDDAAWRSVDLPHDYDIERKVDRRNPGGRGDGFFPNGLAWYRRTFSASQSWQGKQVAIEFGGVYMNADVYINGRHLGFHPYGYTAFSYDLTHYLKIGEKNVLAVRVDNAHWGNTRWYSGSGIYRHVWLTVTGPLHVAHWGTYVATPQISRSKAQVIVQTTLRNDSDGPQNGTLTTQIVDGDGKVVATGDIPFELPQCGECMVEHALDVSQPKLWTPETPALYSADSRVRQGETIADEYRTSFGIRTLKYSVENGMQLNGASIKLCGGCVHHDNGCLGAAAFDRAEERRVELLKAAGFNFIRTSHNPPSEEFLRACDRLGMLVMDEAFDCWEQGKNRYDYNVSFKKWWQRDMDAMLLRDRNHPAVCMWSTGNEIPGKENPNGLRIGKMLADYVRTKDTTRAVTNAVDGNTRNDAFIANLDICGYNYNLNNAAADHRRVPSRVMTVTESTPNAAFDYWRRAQQSSYIIGDCVWTALDYLGESGIGCWNGDPSRSGDDNGFWHGAECGELDSTGYRKVDSHYRNILWDRGEKLYMAVRQPEAGNPPNASAGRRRAGGDMWAVRPAWESWTWPGMKGKEMNVSVFSRFDKVRLYLNNKLLGEKPTGQSEQFRTTFSVPYEPGTLRAAGVGVRGTQELAQQRVGERGVGEIVYRTIGDAAKIHLAPDRAALRADSQDLSYVTVEVLDKYDRVQPSADNLIKFSIAGPGKLVGMDNGDMRDDEPYQGDRRKVWHGRGIAVVRSSNVPGEITLTATADGLAPATITIKAEPTAATPMLP